MIRIDLQLFADLGDIIGENAEAFEGVDLDSSFNPIAAKLNELGYEVLINNKQKAEFVPATRLGEVVGQRDTFKQKVEELNTSLTTMQTAAGENQQLKDDYQKLIDQNNTLLADLETTRVNTEIMLGAKDAIAPKDLLMFINKENITVNAKGEILGVEAEIARLTLEKPYLFKNAQVINRAGMENTSGQAATKVSGMNAMIRQAAHGKRY